MFDLWIRNIYIFVLISFVILSSLSCQKKIEVVDLSEGELSFVFPPEDMFINKAEYEVQVELNSN